MMKPWSNLPVLARSRYPVAMLAGLALAAAFPNLGLAGLGWIAPGLMLAATLGKSGGERFRLGYLAGLTHYLVSLYWLLLIPYRWHGIPLGPATGWLALSGVLALFPAAWVWGTTEVAMTRFKVQSPKFKVQSPEFKDQSPSSILHSPSSTLPPAASGAADRGRWPVNSWGGRTGWALWGAAFWFALEMV